MKYLFFIAVSCGIAFSQTNSSAIELANTERAFSALCAEKGIKESFVEYFADSCVVFNPYPVNGKELYKARKPSNALLSWYPTVVEVAASGDWGFSTGPYEFRADPNSKEADGIGYYFSIWQKQTNGKWKVILDNGIHFLKEQKKNDEERFVSYKISKKKKLQNVLLPEIEKEFAAEVERNGFQKSFEKFALKNARLYREKHFPTNNKKESIEFLISEKDATQYFPLATHTASSGDLGFVYGYSVANQKDSSIYIRVWRMEDNWKIAVDILSPLK